MALTDAQKSSIESKKNQIGDAEYRFLEKW